MNDEGLTLLLLLLLLLLAIQQYLCSSTSNANKLLYHQLAGSTSNKANIM
jgi:hypothetical protein